MRDVARATSAAPTYFEPLRLAAEPPHADYTLVDGGVFANNPGMCAFVDADAGEARPESTLMVSLGTGELTRPLPYDEARSWGVLGWGRRIVDVVFDSASDTVDYGQAQDRPPGRTRCRGGRADPRGYGYIEEYPVCRFYRDAKILTIGEGTDEIQQLVIARALGA